MARRLEFDAAEYAQCFRELGYGVFPCVLGPTAVECLREAIVDIPEGDGVRRKRNVYGVRNLLETSPAVRRLAGSAEIRQFVTPVLGESAFAVRAVFFDKVPDANWGLGWHQDSVISVRERHEVDGFTAWGQKAGVWQVQPPPEILAEMVAVRVHLDDCGPANGPLRILPGSHRHGWLDDEIGEWKRNVAEVECVVQSGGVVSLCPLTLHASSKSLSPGHRRVIHIEFAAHDLPVPLEWNARVGHHRADIVDIAHRSKHF